MPIEEPTIRRNAYMVRKRSRPVSRACAVVESRIFLIIQEMVQRYGIRAVLQGEAAKALPSTEQITKMAG